MSKTRLLLALALLVHSPAVAQRLVVPGDTVRVIVVGDNRPITGVVTATRSQGIELRQPDGTESFHSAGSILMLRIRHGTRSASREGAWIGALLGVGVGVATGVAIMNDGYFAAGPEVIIGGGTIMAGIGALAGALVGAIVRVPGGYVSGALPGPSMPSASRQSRAWTSRVGVGVESTMLVGLRLRR